MITKYFLPISFLILLSVGSATAITEPIKITISPGMDKIIFDGKWTYFTEWKASSLDTLHYDDGMIIILRTAHQNNFIYVFVDVVSDTHLDKNADRAMVCLDASNDKNKISDTDDYCFLAILEGKSAFVYQGGSLVELNSDFKKIPTPGGFIGTGGVSDKNDRYSLIPHASYEFRIPTDLVGRSNNYGFYLSVYDAHTNKVYSWPQNLIVDKNIQIPNPSNWGEMVSPDSSLPEFESSMFILVPAFLIVVYITKSRNI